MAVGPTAALRALEGAEGKALGVASVGVACSTLEEVFHDVGARVAKLLDEGREGDAGGTLKGRGGREETEETEETSPEETSPEETSPSSSSSSSSKKPASALRRDPPRGPSATPRASRATRRTVRSGRFAQFSACLFKRAAHARRDARGFCVSALVPVLFVVAGALAASVPAARAGDPPLAAMDSSFSGGAAIGLSSIGLSSSPDAAASPLDRRRLPPPWSCSESSPVVDRCDADEDAGGPTACAACDALEGTLDAAVLAGAKPRTTCKARTLLRSEAAERSSDSAARAGSCAAIAEEAPRGAGESGDRTPRGASYVLLASPTAYHALPAAMTARHSAAFAAALGPIACGSGSGFSGSGSGSSGSGAGAAASSRSSSSGSDPSCYLRALNHPLPSTPEQRAEQRTLGHLLVAICVVLGLACMSAAAATFPTLERASGAEHLQTLAGVSRLTYWSATYAWDVMTAAPVLAACLFVLSGLSGGGASVGEEQSSSGGGEEDSGPRSFGFAAHGGAALPVVAASLASFAASAFPLAYLCRAPFTTAPGALAGQMGAAFFFGVAQLIASVVLSGLSAAEMGEGGAADAWRACDALFRWLPHYCVGRTLFVLAERRGGGGEGLAAMGAAESDAESPWDVAGGLVAANAVTAVAFVALLALTDQNGRAARGLAEAFWRRFLAKVAAKVFFRGAPRRSPSVERTRGEAAASAAGRGGLADASDADASAAREGGRGGGREGGLSSGLSERARFSSDRRLDLEMGVPAEDSGVAAARVEAEASGALSRGSRVALVVRGLRVRYPGRGADAVDGLSFAARRGECFGLLGVNGAGKSTTFGALSGALAPSDGEALLAVRGGAAEREAPGDDEAPPPETSTISSSSSSSSSFFEIVRVAPAEARARRRVGYCPQRDAVQSTMTVAEHLAFYSALRGGPLRLSSPDVLRLASALELAAFLDVPAGKLSGGTRRKLSVAIALVGDPSLVLLDEPSAGMDPESRLALRRAVGAQCAERGACVVVTSHAMEECEALCRSAAVMARGRARRAGKVRDLLRGLGRGYDLDARLAVGGGRTSDDGDDGANGATLLTRARRFVEAAFPGATPRDVGVSPSRARRTPGAAGDDEGAGKPPGADEAGGLRGEPLGRVGRAARSFRYRLPPEVSAAEAFEAMEAGMEKAGIAAYQLGRPTLEEVFLRVAEEAEAEEAAEGTGVGEEEEERRAGEGGGEGGGVTPRSHPLR